MNKYSCPFTTVTKQNATPTYISISLEHFFSTLSAKGEGTKVQVINQYTPLTFHLTHFTWFLLWEYCRPFVDNEASSIPPSFFHSHIRHLHSQMYQGWINTGILSCWSFRGAGVEIKYFSMYSVYLTNSREEKSTCTCTCTSGVGNSYAPSPYSRYVFMCHIAKHFHWKKSHQA